MNTMIKTLKQEHNALRVMLALTLMQILHIPLSLMQEVNTLPRGLNPIWMSPSAVTVDVMLVVGLLVAVVRKPKTWQLAGAMTLACTLTFVTFLFQPQSLWLNFEVRQQATLPLLALATVLVWRHKTRTMERLFLWIFGLVNMTILIVFHALFVFPQMNRIDTMREQHVQTALLISEPDIFRAYCQHVRLSCANTPRGNPTVPEIVQGSFVNISRDTSGQPFAEHIWTLALDHGMGGSARHIQGYARTPSEERFTHSPPETHLEERLLINRTFYTLSAVAMTLWTFGGIWLLIFHRSRHRRVWSSDHKTQNKETSHV